MQYIPRELVEEAIDGVEMDLEEALREDYSGRGMYSGKCFGIVHDFQSQILRFILYLERAVTDEIDRSIREGRMATVERELVDELVESVSSDSMGFSKITYFPGFTVGDDPDNEYDDEL